MTSWHAQLQCRPESVSRFVRLAFGAYLKSWERGLNCSPTARTFLYGTGKVLPERPNLCGSCLLVTKQIE